MNASPISLTLDHLLGRQSKRVEWTLRAETKRESETPRKPHNAR